MGRRSAREVASGILPFGREEAPRVLLVSGFLLLVIATYVILKQVRRSLFLDDFGVEKVPFVMIAIAVIVGVFVTGYIRLARRVASGPLITVTLLVLVSHLALFWLVALEGARWLSPVLYVWAGCFGVIAPVQVWTLTNEVFATREAKRVVGFIGSAGILGAILGGNGTTVLAGLVGTENLLLVAAVLLCVCIGLVGALGRHRRGAGAAGLAAPGARGIRQAVQAIAGSRHLALIAGLVWIGAATTTSVEYQFLAAADAADFTTDARTGFFGFVEGNVSLVAFVVQLFFVKWLLRRGGLGAAILVLPVAMTLGTAALAILGSLTAATALKASDGAFKHSVDRSAKELAYLPVPGGVKLQVKSTIDMVLDRLGDGCGGALMLLFATGLGLGLERLALVNLALLATWLLLAVRLRGTYQGQLRKAIGTAGARPLALDTQIVDADALASLRKELASDDPGRVLAALDMAAHAPGGEFEEELRRLASGGSAEVRAKAMGMLLEPGGELPEELTERLESEDQDLLVKALDLVQARDAEEMRAMALELIGGASPDTQGAMVALLVHRLGPDFAPVVDTVLASLVEPGAPAEARRAGAAALGLLPGDARAASRLERLLADDEVDVAVQAADSASRLRLVELVPRIVPLLAHRRARAATRRAVRRFGPDAAPALLDALLRPDTDGAVREQVPRLLAGACRPEAAARAWPSLTDGEPEIRHAVLDYFKWRRRLRPAEPLPRRVRELAEVGMAAELARCEDFLALWRGQRLHDADPSGRFLDLVLREKSFAMADRLLGWLELEHPPNRVAALRSGLRDSDRRRRENVIELLESLVPRRLRDGAIAFVERLPWGRVGGAASGGVRGDPERHERLLVDLARGPDRWLAACAVNAAGRLGRRAALDAAREAVGGGDPLLDEELARAERRARVGAEAGMSVGASLVDKVMVLKSIEMFEAIDTDELLHLARIAREEEYAPGEQLFAQGDAPGPLYIVLSGRVALRQGDVSVGGVIPGSPLGAWSMFDDQPCSASAIATEPSRALVIEREDFFDVLSEHAEIVRGVVGHLVQRLRALAV